MIPRYTDHTEKIISKLIERNYPELGKLTALDRARVWHFQNDHMTVAQNDVNKVVSGCDFLGVIYAWCQQECSNHHKSVRLYNDSSAWVGCSVFSTLSRTIRNQTKCQIISEFGLLPIHYERDIFLMPRREKEGEAKIKKLS